MLKKIQKEIEDLRVKVYAGKSLEDTEKALYEIEQMLFKAMDEQLNIPIVSGSADADYWSERCKHAENIWEKNPCDPDITDEQIEAHNGYHNFIKENGSKHYR